MSKTRDTGFLGNVIKVDTNGNVSFVSGSTTLATINTSGQLSGSSPVLSSSYALNADLLDGLDSTQFTLTSSFAAQTASFTAFTASVNSFTASQLVLNGTYATTGSNTFAGIQTINSNLVVTGSITAQTLVVQTITSSVDFVTGSTRFGSILANTHVFTGSVGISGSLSSIGATFSGNVGLGALSSYAKFNISTGDDNQMAIGTTSTSQTAAIFLADGPTTSSVGYKWEFGKNTANNFFIYSYGTAANALLINYSTGAATFSNAAGITNGNGLNLRAGGNTASDANVLNFTSLAGTINVSMFSDAANSNTRLKSLGNLSFHTGNIAISADNERMFISSSGNVGIGTSTPSFILDVNDTNGSGGRGIRVSTSSTSVGPALFLYMNAGTYTNWVVGTSYSTTNALEFVSSNSVGGNPSSAGTTRMLITNTGNVAIGNTIAAKPLSVWPSGGIGVYSNNTYSPSISLDFNSGTNIGHLLADQNAYYIRTLTSYPIYIQANQANGVYLSVGATSFTGNSDERLKNITGNIDNAVNNLLTLRAVNFSWKSDDTNKENLGLIAQDVEQVFPQIIDKIKLPSKVDEEQTDDTEYLGVRYTELIPVLVKAIQEQQAQINELKAQING